MHIARIQADFEITELHKMVELLHLVQVSKLKVLTLLLQHLTTLMKIATCVPLHFSAGSVTQTRRNQCIYQL